MSDNVIQETISTQPAWAETDAPSEAPVEETAEAPEAVEPAESPASEEAQQDPIGEARLKEFIRRENELQQTIQELKQQAAEYEELKTLKEVDPLAAMAKVGLNSDDIINKVLGIEPEAPSDVELTKREIEKLKEELTSFKTERQQRLEQEEKARQEQAVSNFKQSIHDTIESKADNYELCKLAGQEAIERAYAVVEYEFAQRGEVIPVEEALKHVEDAYEVEYKKLAAARKFAKQAQPVQEKSEVKVNPSQAPSSLSSKMQSIAPTTNRPLHMTLEESKRRAAELLRFND